MESKPPPNWCDLSMEMRSECIKWMDFKSKMLLRATSSIEKSLVELAPKHHFDSVQIDLRLDAYIVSCKKKDVETVKIERKTREMTPEFVEKVKNLVSQILKFTVVEKLGFWSNLLDYLDAVNVLLLIDQCSPLNVSTFGLQYCIFWLVQPFLGSWKKPEHIQLEIGGGAFDDDEILELVELESILKLEKVKFFDLQTSEAPYRLIQKWIENDAEIGKTLKCSIEADDDFSKYLTTELEHRIVSRGPKFIRIRTDNDAKHILLRFVVFGDLASKSLLSCVVIPAEMDGDGSENDADEAREHYIREAAAGQRMMESLQGMIP